MRIAGLLAIAFESMPFFLVIRTFLIESPWSSRRLVGEHQGIGPPNPAGWDRQIAPA
jgi:hypothetical protein